MKKRSQMFTSYVPSKRLQDATNKLLEKYPRDDITRRLRAISRFMNDDAEAIDNKKQKSRKDIFEEDLSEEDLSEAVEAGKIEMAAFELNQISDLIIAITEAKPLHKKLIAEDGNTSLQMFKKHKLKIREDAPVELKKTLAFNKKVLALAGERGSITTIDRCLKITKGWCYKNRNILNDHADELAKNISTEKASSTALTIHFLDETAGMFQAIKDWAVIAKEEVSKARKAASRGDRGAA